MLPVGIMPDYRVELTIEQASQAVVAYATGAQTLLTGTPTWTLSDIRLNLFYMDVDPQVADALYQANGGVYKISTEFYRSFITTLTGTRTSDSILIPIRVSSLKTLLVGYRAVNDYNSAIQYGVSNRLNPWYSASAVPCSIQFAIGSILEPNNPIRYGLSELYTMLLQSQHSLGSVSQFNRMALTNWKRNVKCNNTTGNAQVLLTSAMGTALVGINLETFIFKTKSITCGINSLTSPVFLQTSYPTSQTIDSRVVSIAHYDALVTISEAGVDVRF